MPQAAAAVARREATLTKPPRSLGRLEEVVEWLGLWQGRNPPRLDNVEILVFAGNHGVTAQGVSAYPAEVTAQMVANFAAGGAAINQLARVAGAELRVSSRSTSIVRRRISLRARPWTRAAFLEAVSSGYDAVAPEADLVVLGEMGIGNTTAASAIAAALFGGGGARFAGHGTGIDEQGSSASARRSTARSPGMARSSTILCASPPRSADASLPRSSAPRSPRATQGFRCCSTASSAPPRSRRWHEAPRRCARPCSCRASLGRVGPHASARRTRPLPAARSRHAARRGLGRRASPSSCCAPRSPATPAWRLLPRRKCRRRTLKPWRWRERRRR